MKENEAYQAFLDIWHDVMLYVMFACFALAFLMLAVYWLRYLFAKDAKAKFDLASEKEIKVFLRANYFIAFAIFCLINQTYVEMVSMGITWKLTRIFIGIFAASLHAYVAYLVFKFYYPGPLEKRLKKLRYAPRLSTSGSKMKLLSEDEEDAYLDEGMQAEENAFSVDYDVWIDPETKETKIERYKGHLSALECDNCGFQTLKLQREQVLRQPTEYDDGELQKEYKCTYCGRVKRKTVRLARKMEGDHDHARLIDNPVGHDHRIDIVKIEIKGSHGENKTYEFQNIYQAKLFLEEFKFEKLRDEEVY